MAMALEGIRVLDVTRLLAGPFCGMLLADMGAEVIHVERPGTGDENRHTAPVLSGTVGTCFLASNRNKKGITLNLSVPEGAALFKRLVGISDVVIENFRPGTFARWGLSYEELARVNPRIVVTSISGFGQYGPYSHKVGLDIVAQAMGGLMSFTGQRDGPPTRTGNAMGDFLAALFATYGTLAALYHREKSGRGQWVDVSMVDAVIAVLENALTNYMALREVIQRDGSRIRGNAPYNTYQARDGWLVVGVTGNAIWRRLVEAMGREDLLADERFASDELRRQNADLLDKIVGDWVGEHTVQEVVDLLEKHGVPCGPVYSADRVVRDPHVAAREMLVEVQYPGVGSVWVNGVCPKLSLTPGRVYAPPPTLGQHNEDVYCGLLGLEKAYLDELRQRNVI